MALWSWLSSHTRSLDPARPDSKIQGAASNGVFPFPAAYDFCVAGFRASPLHCFISQLPGRLLNAGGKPPTLESPHKNQRGYLDRLFFFPAGVGIGANGHLGSAGPRGFLFLGSACFFPAQRKIIPKLSLISGGPLLLALSNKFGKARLLLAQPLKLPFKFRNFIFAGQIFGLERFDFPKQPADLR